MGESEYWSKFMDRKYSRRQVLRGGLLAGAGLAAVSVVGCNQKATTSTTGGGTPKKGGRLRSAWTADADHFDPQLDTAWTMVIGSWIYSKLLKFSYDVKELQPDLAESWEQPDPTTYIFKLRKNVKWHNGSEFTADDVVFTLDRVRNADLKSPHAYKVGPLAKVEAVDKYTVKCTLKEVFAPFINYMGNAWMFMLNKNAVGTSSRFTTAMGTGPYVLKEWKKGVSATMERNKDYFVKDRPYPDGIDFQIIPDRSSILAAVKANRLDYTYLEGNEVEEFEKAPGLQVVTGPYLHWGFLIYNCSKKPFSDVRVRKAIDLAIDRQGILKVVYYNKGKLNGPVPWSHEEWALPQDELQKRPGFRTPKDQDIAEAKKLLEAAGVTLPLKLKHITTTPAAHLTYNQLSIALKDQLKAINVELDLVIGDMGQLQAARTSGEYDSCAYVNAGSEEVDEYVFGPHRTGQARNVNRYSNPEVDALLDKQRTLVDKNERKKTILEVQRKLMDEVPSSWLAGPYTYAATQKFVKEFKPYASWTRHAEIFDVWLDK